VSVSANDPDIGNTLTFQLLTAPVWLSLSDDGVFSGTPSHTDIGSGIEISIIAMDNNGLSDTLITSISVINDVFVEKETPTLYMLYPPYPNPFNIVTNISYYIPKQSYVTLSIYSMSGQKEVSLIDGFVNAGKHEIIFDGSGLASGIYLYCFESGVFYKTGKIILMK
jgi:hypothetical protein